MKIRIIQCSEKGRWHINKIGEEYFAKYNPDDNEYHIINLLASVPSEDCEIVKSKKEIIKELQEQIELMKNCSNCNKFPHVCDFKDCNNYSDWEIKK